jgi:hypothetical protein
VSTVKAALRILSSVAIMQKDISIGNTAKLSTLFEDWYDLPSPPHLVLDNYGIIGNKI